MLFLIYQIPTFAEINQEELGKHKLLSNLINSEKMTNGQDVARLNEEKNDLEIKFPHKVQGDLINQLAEKRLGKNTVNDHLIYVQVRLDSKEFLSKINKFNITGYNENFAILHLTEKELSDLILIDSVKTVGLPNKVVKLSHKTSEGVSFMGAAQMQNAGYTGSGIKVAVIDGGVDPTDPEFSNRVVYSHLYDSANDCTGNITCGDPTHGDAVSEIIVDMAPNVTLYLYSVENPVDFGNAVDDAISKNVDIISSSLGFDDFGSVDTVNFRDGHSFVAKKINQASDAGILSVIAAGNEGQQHWKGTYSVSPSIASSLGLTGVGYQSVHVFNPNASGNLKACLPVTDFGDSYILTWNNWPTTDQDYDLLVFDSTMSTFYGISDSFQTGSQEPLEGFFPHDVSGGICIVIASWNSNQNASFHFYTSYNDLNDSFEVRSGSINTPADATGSLAVGAVNVSDNTLEDFSSSGPTDDNRNKPEVCGVDNTFSHQYSPFTFQGTSAAAPHIAGAAALILEQNPFLSVSQLKSKITQNTIQSTYSANNLCGTNSGVTNLDSLATPRNLVSTVKSPTEIELSWSSYNTATGYKIERESPTGTGFSTLVPNTDNTKTTYNDISLTPGISYNYRVSAIIPSGTTNPSNESSATTSMTKPSAPTDLTATSGNTQVTLSWTAPNNGGSAITDYIIEYRQSVTSEITITTAPGSSSPGCETTADGCFVPKEATVDVGEKVIFSNTDTAAHTFTAGDATGGPSGEFDSGLTIAGSSYEWTPTTVGEYPYFCMVHPWMGGIITVQIGGPFTVYDDGITASTGATVTGLTNGITYEFQISAINSIGTGPTSNISSAIPTSQVLCIPPISGEWIIISDCTIIDTIVAPDNVLVQNNAILTIENGGTLDIDFLNHNLTVKSGSGVLVKSGGKITSYIIGVSISPGDSSPGCEATNSCFIPFDKKIIVGDTVKWTNNDSAAHTITSGTSQTGPDGTFDSGLILAGATFLHTFNSAGTYDYYCQIHPWMGGKITV